MTIGDKIKHALKLDKDKAGGAGVTDDYGSGSTSATGAGRRTTDTGPEAYQPLTHSAEGQQTGSHTGAGRTGTGSGVDGTTTGTGAGTGQSGRGTSVNPSSQQYSDSTGTRGQSGLTGGKGTGSSTSGTVDPSQGTGTGSGGEFQTGYAKDAPGYSDVYRGDKPVYTENIKEGDDGSYSADLSARSNNKGWEEAIQKTRLAEQEAAHANLAGNRAQRELSAAEQAEEAIRRAQIKHREALEEAEKYRARLDDPSLKEGELADARELYNRKRSLADEAERAIREAEADAARKKRDADKLHPEVEKYGTVIPGLEEELQRKQRARQAAEADAEKYGRSAREAEEARTAYATDLEALEAELSDAERFAAQRQSEYIDARNRAQGIAQRLDELRAKLRDADEALAGRRGRAHEAEENLPAYREAEERALRELENARSEWYRLKQLEDDYANAFKSARDRHQALLADRDPASKELRDAQGLLSARQDDLDRARARSQKAEAEYKKLLALADRHKKYGDSAAGAAEAHGAKYEDLKREAHIHGDKHVELWTEAKTAGEAGSTEATSAVKKLEEKVRNLMKREN